MSRLQRSHLSRIAVLASGAMLLLGGSALAQAVSVFDDAPSIERLRSIMIPESRPGTSRSIVIQSPDVVSPPAAKVSRPAVVQAAASVPAPPTPQAPHPESADGAGAVAFHVNFGFNSA